MKHALIFIAIILVIIWVVARATLAVTSVALHVLWIVAIILAVVWLIGRLKGPRVKSEVSFEKLFATAEVRDSGGRKLREFFSIREV